jgi:hypothetical protein
MSYLDELDNRKHELMNQHPGWQVWYVPHSDRTITWCARPNPLLNEDSPEHLAEAIAQAEQAETEACAAHRKEQER